MVRGSKSSGDTMVDNPRLAVIDEALDHILDAGLNGSELVYRVEKNGGLVNAVTGQKFDVLIHLSKEPWSTDAHQAVKIEEDEV
ncbi:hypothetical protein M0R45_007265 [Rubus argutus]|uniref:Uncharacterized protein n=1 Tax=Rubus argutus TaxID=59490 RepID=A0AAW1XXV2_RUBAR